VGGTSAHFVRKLIVNSGHLCLPSIAATMEITSGTLGGTYVSILKNKVNDLCGHYGEIPHCVDSIRENSGEPLSR